ncbi:MAG: hypothetical protein EA370_13715 [Wenzhouxiangella sp.]|nr:MAG: hypothetical protein EA370_13715 [Wenzhouxiangella sp.]
MADLRYQSKALRDGGMVRLMDIAIRGMPRAFLPGPPRVDVEWAKGLYDPEIRTLDSLNAHSAWFWSGISGAALLSLALWPQTAELWRRLAQRTVYRDEQGMDAACLLYELIERHRDDGRLTRLPDFQLYVFQSAMAVAESWVFGDPSYQRMQSVPPVPDVPALIERVRKYKGEDCRTDGFRPSAYLHTYWSIANPPLISHAVDMATVVTLASEVVALERKPSNLARLSQVATWIAESSPPPELCHPAALAAALVTISQDEHARTLWQRVFQGKGIRQPNPGKKPVVDAAMRIRDCITDANRSTRPNHDAALLYYRCRQCVTGWQTDPDRLWTALPRIPDSTVTASGIWAQQRVRYLPVLRFRCDRPLLHLSDEAHE